MHVHISENLFNKVFCFQILAQQRAEQCSQLLITILLDIFHNIKESAHHPCDSVEANDDLPGSDNSSMEIYR